MKRRGRIWKCILLLVAVVLFAVSLPQGIFYLQNKRLEGKKVQIPGSEKEQELLGIQSFYTTEELLEIWDGVEESGQVNAELKNTWEWGSEEFLRQYPEAWGKIQESCNKHTQTGMLPGAALQVNSQNIVAVECYQLFVKQKDETVLRTTLWQLEFWAAVDENDDGLKENTEVVTVLINPKDYGLLASNYWYHMIEIDAVPQEKLGDIYEFCKTAAVKEGYTINFGTSNGNIIEVEYGNENVLETLNRYTEDSLEKGEEKLDWGW